MSRPADSSGEPFQPMLELEERIAALERLVCSNTSHRVDSRPLVEQVAVLKEGWRKLLQERDLETTLINPCKLYFLL
jgi:hypothetical protein